jgi:hypothetical protein
MRVRKLSAAALLLLTCGVLAPGARGEAQDEVVREVVRMLEAGVTGRVIVGWLDRESLNPGTLGSDDIIALTRAGASPPLMDRLMALADERNATPAPAAEPPAEIPVEFSIRYRPYRDPEGEEDEQWHLFVYLDGKLLAWSEGRNWLSNSRKTVEVHPHLPPGRHVLRLVQERHRRAGQNGWRHDARVCPDAIEFVTGRTGQRVEIQIVEPAGLSLRGSRTFVWSLWQEGIPQDEGIDLAGPPGDWPPLCEEIESGYAEGDKIPKRVRKQLDRCLRWDSLWPGLTEVPDRDEVRAELERFDFRPAVASN